MKKRLIFFILFAYGLLFQPWAGAEQVQAEDYLMVDGQGHYIRADPLSRYLSIHCSYDSLKKYVETFCLTSWPNYTKYWKVQNGILYLERIENGQGEEYPLDKLFPWYEGRPLKAQWFSGIVSYRKDDSPVVTLNRDYYLEEHVIRFVEGREVERFTVNHRDRWLSYARRIMDEYYPLAGYSPDAIESSRGQLTGLLKEAFSVVTHPEESSTQYCPVIAVEFNADITDLTITEAHGKMSSYELLEDIALQTETVLDTTISNRLVIYTIREADVDVPDTAPTASR